MCFLKKWFGKRSKEPKETEQKTEVLKEEKVEKPEEKPKAPTTEKKQEPIEGQKNDKAVKYHVSQNKDSKSKQYKKWRVRKEGSTKTIKYFDTQKEAIEYAEGLAESQEGSIVIHKVDGTIRKQNYSK